MKAWTGIEIEEERQRLEAGAASLLGQLIFEYSRLEMELGMVIVWSGEGQKLEKLTSQMADVNLNERLNRLAVMTESLSVEGVARYRTWLAEAHRLRNLRNQFFHGRWGISPVKQQVFNVIGLPTSAEQREVGYSLTDLQDVLSSVYKLRLELSHLVKSWPV